MPALRRTLLLIASHAAIGAAGFAAAEMLRRDGFAGELDIVDLCHAILRQAQACFDLGVAQET